MGGLLIYPSILIYRKTQWACVVRLVFMTFWVQIQSEVFFLKSPAYLLNEVAYMCSVILCM